MTAEEFYKEEYFVVRDHKNGYSKEQLFEFAEAYADYQDKQIKELMDYIEEVENYREMYFKLKNTIIDQKRIFVSQAKRTVCPDCGDYGWLYNEDGSRKGTCPCHY